MFKKGQSGNPKGRPKLSKAAIQARRDLQKLTPRAVEVLADALESDDEALRIKAAVIIIERVYGKAPQELQHTGKDGGTMQAVIQYVTMPG